MAARRLVIVMLVLLGISTIAAALVPVDRDESTDESSTTSTVTDEPGQDAGELVPGSIDADARNRQIVRIELGDQLELRVTSRRNDQAEIPRLGELEDVGPDAPAHFDLLPFETGRYTVRLVEAGRAIGRIAVRPPARPKRDRKPS